MKTNFGRPDWSYQRTASMAENNRNPNIVITWRPRRVCFHFLSGQDSVRTCRWLIKKYPPALRRSAATRGKKKKRVSEGSGEPADTFVATSPRNQFFFLLTKKQGTCALSCEQFPRYSRLLSGLHNEGRGAAEFLSYHKLACVAPLLSPQSSSNCCNWTSPLLSSKRRCSIAYAPNALDNESRAAGQEGRRARCCSVNKFQSH